MTKTVLFPVWVIIPAAGVGERMKLGYPKQYLKINHKALIEHTLACFTDHSEVAGIVVALAAADPYWNQLDIKTTAKPIYTVQGGANRNDSVMQALDYLSRVEKVVDESWVMVHDAARPCLSQADINSLLAIRSTDSVGGLLASPVRDTMKRSFSGKSKISHTEPRKDLWHALTPQMFRLGQLKNALEICQNKNITVTDEASAMESIGEHPLLLEGSHNNIKVTHPADIELAMWLLNNKSKKS